MTFHPIASHWKKIFLALRCCIYLIFALDIAIWFQMIPLPMQSASKWSYLPWFLYRLSYYLFFEYLWHHYARYRTSLIHIFTLILLLLLCGIALDLAGNSFSFFTKLWWYDRMIHLTTFPWGLCALFWLFTHIFSEKHRLLHLFWFIPYGMITGLALVTTLHEIIEYS